MKLMRGCALFIGVFSCHFVWGDSVSLVDIEVREAAGMNLPPRLEVLSGDGKVWGGGYPNKEGVIVEDGSGAFNYTSTLRENRKGYSSVIALSYRGDIAAGVAENQGGVKRAVRWAWKEGDGLPEDLGTLREDDTGGSAASALSYDGNVVAGQAESASGEQRAVRWTGRGASLEKEDLGTLRKNNAGHSKALALSYDGNVVAGFADNDEGGRAVRWTGRGTSLEKEDLGTLRQNNNGASMAMALSHDGSVVVGEAESEHSDFRAVRWTGRGASLQKEDLGTLRSDNRGFSSARGVSSDGNVVVGSAFADSLLVRAFIWTKQVGMIDLGSLRAGKLGSSHATAMSADGTVVGGVAENDQGKFRSTLWKVTWGPGSRSPVETPEPPVVTPEPPVVAPPPPVATPEPPVVAPQPPVATPEPPVVAPQPPVVIPEPPVVAPQPPVVAPQPPVVTPEPPVVAPQPPVVTPEPPVETPKPPVVTPEPPVETPQPPVVTPKPPVVAPQPPMVTPEPPVVAPQPPVVTPEPPVVVPQPPVVTPEPPVVVPQPPVVTPEPPVVAPQPPVVTPEPPVVAPQPPVVTPEPPVVVPQPPVVTPEPPVVVPQPPVVTPESPVVAPQPPVVTPEPPVVAPQPPVVTPEPPVVAPQPPVVTPEPPVETPQPPVVTPEPPVVAPQPPVVTPEPPVVAPQPPVVTPEPPVVAPQPPVVAPEPPVVAPKPPVDTPKSSRWVASATPTDIANARKARYKLASDTFQVMEMQRNALKSLVEGCDTRTQGEVCVAGGTGYRSSDDSGETVNSIRLGVGLTDNLSAGISVGRSLVRKQPDSFTKNNDNLGVGAWVNWRFPDESGEWYLRLAGAQNRYETKIATVDYGNADSGKGTPDIDGWTLSVEGGRQFRFASGTTLTTHAGVVRDSLKREAYTDSGNSFAYEYAELEYETDYARVGAALNVPVTSKLAWITAATVEQDLSNDAPVFSGKQGYVGDVQEKMDLKHTRWNVGSGLAYEFTPGIEVRAIPWVGTQALGDTQYGANLTLFGRF